MITNINQLDPQSHYTFSDYLQWKFPERVELFLGKVFRMSPAPSLKHQRLSGRIYVAISVFLVDKPCEAFPAPFDVKLPVSSKKGKPDTVVQPDITVVCDSGKLAEWGCDGAPDLVVEILSPGNTKKEMKQKFSLYEQSGIPEYWVVDPDREHILQYTLNEAGKYRTGAALTTDDLLECDTLNSFQLSLAELFETQD